MFRWVVGSKNNNYNICYCTSCIQTINIFTFAHFESKHLPTRKISHLHLASGTKFYILRNMHTICEQQNFMLHQLAYCANTCRYRELEKCQGFVLETVVSCLLWPRFFLLKVCIDNNDTEY